MVLDGGTAANPASESGRHAVPTLGLELIAWHQKGWCNDYAIERSRIDPAE